MHAFPARHPGTCPACDEDIAIGQPIVRGASLDGSSNVEVYQHEWCAVAAQERYLASSRPVRGYKPNTWRRKSRRD